MALICWHYLDPPSFYYFCLCAFPSLSSDSNDYINLPSSVTIPLASPPLSEFCFTVLVVGDAIIEEDEEVVINLSPTNRNDVIINSIFTIIILDDGDGKF